MLLVYRVLEAGRHKVEEDAQVGGGEGREKGRVWEREGKREGGREERG